MKIRLIAILVFFSVYGLQAQNFYVVKVEGKIMVDNKVLNTGDKLNAESVVKFASVKDKLYLLSPSDGYFLLAPEAKKENSNEFLVALKNAILPKNKYYKTATRSGGTTFKKFDDIYDLMGFFRDKVLIIDEAVYAVNTNKIPLNKDNTFEFINTKNKTKLAWHAHKDSFSISGIGNGEQFEMIYIQNEKRTNIGTFYLHNASRKTIANELAVLFTDQKQIKTTQNYYEQVVPYLAEVYGNTNMETIRDIIKNDLNIPLNIMD